MAFEQQLRGVVATLASAQQHGERERERAENIIALHAPSILRRFAEMADAFDAPGLRSGQGTILARRGAHGYTLGEYAAIDLHILAEVVDGEARLSWLAGGETDDRLLLSDTPQAMIDAAILDAVSAYVNTRPAILAHKEGQKES
jgi:hypothetical protein